MNVRKNLIQDVVSLICLILVYGFMVNFFTLDLMFSPTITTGGDMGSHYLPAHYLNNYLLPHGKLIGWCPDWLAGTPLFQFYFLPPYLLMCLLSYLIGLPVAFKLVTVLGIFLLPLTSFFSMRALGFKFPAPAIAAGFSTLFLFLESYSQWGGNIPSTLAGEFCYMISFSLTILLFGTLYYGIRENKLLLFNSVLLAAVVLTHIYTSIFITCTAVFFLLGSKRAANFRYLFKLYLFAGLISGFWTLPFIAKMAFSAAPKDIFFGFPGLDKFINPSFTLFYFFSSISLAFGLFGKVPDKDPAEGEPGLMQRVRSVFCPEARACYFLWALLCGVGLIFSIRYVNLLYIRFISFIYFLPLLLAADGVSRFTARLKAKELIPLIAVLFTLMWVNFGASGLVEETAGIVGLKDSAFVAGIVTGLEGNSYVAAPLSYIPSWIKWNYEGLEVKNQYSSFRDVNIYLSEANLSGRVDFEYSAAYNKFGTPRVFEASPVFSNRSVMESLLLESSLTFPYFYYLQTEMSQESWWPGFPIERPSFDPDTGAQTLEIFNVQYFVASTHKTKAALSQNPRFRLIETVGEFEVYLVNENSSYVELAKREPLLVITDDWKTFSYDWISSDYRDVPLVYVSDPDSYDLRNFRTIVLDKPMKLDGNAEVFYPENMSLAVGQSEPIESDCHISETMSEERIDIHTDCIGKPLIVKVSYFPNWKVDGAKKIYLISPSLMMIIPEEEDIVVYYGQTFADIVGNMFTVTGILAVLYMFRLRYSIFREKIHTPLLRTVRYEGVCKFLQESARGAKNLLLPPIRNILWDKKKLAALIAVAFLLGSGWYYLDRTGKCSSYCVSRGFCGGNKFFRSDIIDHFDLGSSHSSENEKRNFECTAVCDESRTDMVYVSGGGVTFDMRVIPGEKNTLSLNMWDNANCRSGDLYINDIFAARIQSNGKYDWNEFKVDIAPEYAVSETIRVHFEHTNPECYGWDISDAYIIVPNCICY